VHPSFTSVVTPLLPDCGLVRLNIVNMAEHEMQAAELHELAVEQGVSEKRKGSVNPEKTNLDLGFSAPVADNKMEVALQESDTDTPDDEEPNEYEKTKLRRG
jgi:hypothetical protein